MESVTLGMANVIVMPDGKEVNVVASYMIGACLFVVYNTVEDWPVDLIRPFFLLGIPALPSVRLSVNLSVTTYVNSNY